MSRTTDKYYAAVYWVRRKEPIEACARRTEAFFNLLSQCDPIYARWFEQADSRKKALQLQFEPTYETFLRFFRRRKYNEGAFGFSFSAWTGHEEQALGGMAMLGCGSDAATPPNNCLLYLPKEELGLERVLTARVLGQVMRAMALAWEPDWGGVFSDAYQSLRNEPVGPPRTGWLMYFSRHWGQVPPLPEPVHTESVEDKGTLVILTPERFDGHDPAHVALADQVRTLLDEAGLVKEFNAPEG
ncbi:MAG TPA: immunity 52 family protein [Archangium sp.]|uniref:immunity 52 family protein n=1 Tax=Archangium sp. TaxID=1872627 RepID=UPI002E331D8E|nr:immunity 52 family protein [Archangium sp.]HEX5752111.1 immunity 52 family protein [Archangium sp.]